MVAYWDIDQVCVFANDAYRLWFGKSRPELIGTTLERLLGPLYSLNLPHIQAAYAGKTQVFERDIPVPDGSVRHSLATYTPHVVNGEVRGIFVHVADVTRLKRLESALRNAKDKAEHLATHDFLTGLPNRVLLLDRIGQALALARRNRLMVGVLCLDVDDFKAVNDTFGHGAGDRLIVEMASRMRKALRETDTVTRLGGDEFLLLTPAIASTEQVEVITRHILEEARQPFRIGDATVSPTASIGIALYPGHGTTPEELIASADQALYIAKKRGKNGYAIADAVRRDPGVG
jgi:diguanylate cyclase (GGDEF)-like protein/PAS domain S-box-containing protein